MNVEYQHIVKELYKYVDSDDMLVTMPDDEYEKFVEDIYWCKYFGLPKNRRFPSDSIPKI